MTSEDNAESGNNWQLPDNFEWFKLQIAGHHHDICKNGIRQIGIIKNRNNNRILKPVQKGVRGSSEVGLYNLVFVVIKSANPEIDQPLVSDDPILAKLAAFIPIFYGTTVVHLGNIGRLFLELEDVTCKYRHPCVMDVKVGARTFDPVAGKEKIIQEEKKYPPGAVLGFRLLGMKIFDSKTCNIVTKDKTWGKQLKEDHIVPALESFFVGRHQKYRLQVIDSFICQLKSIVDWFKMQKRFHFYSSSLLLVYEGDETAVSGPSANDLSTVAMIDFGHVFDADTVDTNYLFGLNGLIGKLNRVKNHLTTS